MLLSILAADLVTKHLVSARMVVGESISVIPGFFSLTSVRNKGGAFGMLSGLPEPWGRVFFVGIASISVLIFLWMLFKLPEHERWPRFALTAMVGGALGNLYDRVRWGEVVDFFDFYVGNWHYPAFNIADSCIVVAAAILVLSLFGQSESQSE